LLASLDSQRVLTPILETFKAKHLTDYKVAPAKGLDKVESSEQIDRMDHKAAKEVQSGLTNIANAIIQVLGDPGKDRPASPKAERKEESKTPAVINIPVFPMTPSPAEVVKPFIVDTPIDSEAFPKRIRTAEPEKPAGTPDISKDSGSTLNFSFGPAILSQPSQPAQESVLFPPSQVSNAVSEALDPSLPVFDFHLPGSDASQSDNNSLMREARQCSSGELPEFVF
jgi:hypothetical protein